ncbi:HtaA domain-containing protein [Streptomyces olivoreticuli]
MTVTARRAALAALATATALGATVLTAPAFAAEAPNAQQQGEASAPASASADTSTAGGAAPKSVEVPPSSEAPKAGQELKEGALAWGVKQSLRDDIKSGKIKAEGASQAKDNGVFTFAEGKGAYDKSTDSVTATFKGSVHFQGYEDAEHGYKLDVKLSDLTVVTAAKGKTGEIRATVTKGSNAPKTVAIATLEYVEHTAREGVHAFKKIPAKLTAAGAEAFTYTGDEKPYKVGDELDSLDFSVKPPTTDQVGDGASQDGGDKSKGKDDKDNKGKDSKGKAGVELFDGNLDWGLSETFRKYIDNTSGQATVSGGATRFKGGYRFPKDGEGTYDPNTSKLDVTFKGAVRFTANGGKLDLNFSDFKVSVTGKTGTIRAKVTSANKTVLDGALLADLTITDSLKPKDGVVGLSEAPARLAKGAGKAFEFGTNQIVKEGDALDPLTVAVATDKNAKLPDVPSDTGSDKSTDTTGSTGTTATNTTSTTGGTGSTSGGTTTDTTASGSLASTGANTPTGPLLGGAAALIAVGGGAVYAARRRKAGQQG